jgi:ankyrin repeat protein
MFKTIVCGVLVLAVLVSYRPIAFAQAPDATPSRMIEPQLKQSRLLVDGQTLEPARIVVSPVARHYVAGQFCLEVDGSQIAALDRADLKPRWSIKSGDGKHLELVTTTKNIAYFQAYEVDKNGQFERFCAPPQIRRLDLSKPQWLEPLAPGLLKHEKGRPGIVLSALANDDYLIALSTTVEQDPNERAHVSAYIVSCFANGQTKPLWTKSLAAAKARGYSGGILWASRVPRYAASNLQQLSWLGDRLLVCAEAKQPLYCLNPDTGIVLWSCERIWEYQRGFIGPSVWQHYIERFGIESSFDRNEKTIGEEAERFNKQFDCSIVGGPIVVPLTKARRDDTHSIFVVVAREPKGALSGYLADCLVYEFSDQGKPISTVNLPQLVNGSELQVVPDGVVWQGANDSLMRLRTSKEAPNFGFGPGGFDALTRIDWFRQSVEQRRTAWLVTECSGAPIAFNRTYAVRLPAGGFVTARGDHVFQFPLSIVVLQSGMEREIVLRVPFRGDLIAPSESYSTIELPDGGNGYHTVGPYEIAITQLELIGPRLEIMLGMRKWVASVEFDLGSMVVEKTASPAMDAWIRSLGGPDSNGRDKNTALIDAATDYEIYRLKALLDAGANPRARSKDGTTALMRAAGYGTADAVDLLVAAGSDVNARDQNSGNRSMLTLAAGSRRDAKRKVRRLLAAGADRSATPTGWNALLSAALNQDIATVELLISEGFDVNHQSAGGGSALMAAARGTSVTLLRILLNAGAKIECADKGGKTALMYAAEGFATPELIQILLTAGADAHRKDKNGRTAIDLCRLSNVSGNDLRAKVLESAMNQKSK